MALAEIFPFDHVGAGRGEPYPAWIRSLRKRNGVYLIRYPEADTIAYVGESHSNRLYRTLTRHFQDWTNAHDTAGATYDRADVIAAAIVVPRSHALYLQNELICALDPTDNRLVCGQGIADLDGNPTPLPRSYDHDALAIIDALNGAHDADIPF